MRGCGKVRFREMVNAMDRKKERLPHWWGTQRSCVGDAYMRPCFFATRHGPHVCGPCRTITIRKGLLKKSPMKKDLTRTRSGRLCVGSATCPCGFDSKRGRCVGASNFPLRKFDRGRPHGNMSIPMVALRMDRHGGLSMQPLQLCSSFRRMPESRDFAFVFVFSLFRFSWSSCDSVSPSALGSGFRRNDGGTLPIGGNNPLGRLLQQPHEPPASRTP